MNKGSKEAEQLRKGRVNRILAELREQKARQASTVARLQDLVKGLSKKLDVPIDGFGVPTTSFDPMTKLADIMSTTEFEMEDLKASLNALKETLVSAETFPAVDFDEGAFPNIAESRRDIAQKEALLAKQEAVSMEGKKSDAYAKTRAELEALNESLVVLIQDARAQWSNQKIEAQIAEKRQRLAEKEQLFEALHIRRDELRHELSERVDSRLELQFASEQLQRAMDLYKKISERESELSSTANLPKDLADEMWGNSAQPNSK